MIIILNDNSYSVLKENQIIFHLQTYIHQKVFIYSLIFS